MPLHNGATDTASLVYQGMITGASLGNVPVPVSIALVFDDEDQVEA